LCAAGAAAIAATNLSCALLLRSPVRARLRLFRLWSRLLLRLLGARVETAGVPPRPPFFLVSNHHGYVDIALLASRVEAVFVSRDDVSRWPVFGWLSRSVGTLYVDRETKRDLPRVAAAMETVLAEGIGIVLFPEGTSTGGPEPLPFRPSLLEPAVRLRMPVHFAAISYRTSAGLPPAADAVCWWNDAAFVPHLLGLLRLPGFEARIVIGDAPIVEADRKTLARSLERAVRIGLCAPWPSSLSPAADTSSATTGTKAGRAPTDVPPRSIDSGGSGCSPRATPTAGGPGSASTPRAERSAS
jgi:1-acyl-sn-glycerol-3-phosphate acyltransferase